MKSKLSKLLFKPKWQEKNPDVRRNAVLAGDDTELDAALPEIARRDEDAGVRLAALQRLNDYEAWRERSTGDADGRVRNAAREAYIAMLCSGAANAPAMTRRIAELETLSEDEIERVAASAADVALRRDAIARVAKLTLIAQRAVADPDAVLRLSLVERVNDPTLLERIAERTRKTDKAVSRRARELLQAVNISAGNPDAIAMKARSLCERAEALMRSPHTDADAELNNLQSAWTSLGTGVSAELSARFRGAHALALQALDTLRNPPPAAPPRAPMAEVLADAPPAQPRAPAPEFAAAQAQAREDKTRHKAWRHGLEQSLDEMSAALESGDSAAALRLQAQIAQVAAQFAEVPAELREKMDAMLLRHAELKRWQHWSNNQRRRTLCADIEGLIDSGMHPDAVATRVREAREEWQRLDAAEGIAADAATNAAGISRRFHAVCQHALRPTRAYFAKRKEVRVTHAHEIEALLGRATAIGDDSTEWKTIAELRTQSSDALRSLDGVDPKQRGELAKRLKDVIARLSALSATHERDVEAAKNRLIEQATALANRADGAGAPRETHELQKRWTALGNGRRATDQRQWREFRAACDAVFGKLDAQRKERDAAAAATREQAQHMLDELAALGASSGDAETTRKQLRELDARWAATATDDRALSKRQRELHDQITLQLKDAERRKRLARFSAALGKYVFLRAIEAGTGSAAEWVQLPTAGEFDAALQTRHDRTADTNNAATEDDEAARELLVHLEFLAGIDSPEEDRPLRMNLQVQRLSSRMRDRTATTPERELSNLLNAWFAQPQQMPALEERFTAAAQAIIDSLP